jgi:quinol monooxygenase YgiN
VIHVLATIQLAPGARERFLAEFRRLEPLVRAESGCIEYIGVVDAPTPIAAAAPRRNDVLTVIEKWASEAALAAHLEAPHMLDYRTRTMGLARETTIRVLQSI